MKCFSLHSYEFAILPTQASTSEAPTSHDEPSISSSQEDKPHVPPGKEVEFEQRALSIAKLMVKETFSRRRRLPPAGSTEVSQ